MTLPTVGLIKSYLRIAPTNMVEDDLINLLIANAKALCEQYLERPIDQTTIDFTDEARTSRAYPVITELLSPQWPCDPASVSVTDVDGATVDATTYFVDGPTARIIANAGESFDNGPYTISMSVGLSTDPAYNTRIEPVLGQIILDLTAELYTNRTPGTTYESAGGGVAVAHVDRNPIPPRTQMLLDRLRAVPIA